MAKYQPLIPPNCQPQCTPKLEDLRNSTSYLFPFTSILESVMGTSKEMPFQTVNKLQAKLESSINVMGEFLLTT
ncbi:hypothetical protein ACTXT7_004737 [Hymenolepis weldensis]